MLNLYIIYTFILFTLVINIPTFIRYRESFSKSERWLFVYLFLSIFFWVICNTLLDIVKIEMIALFFARISVLFPLNILNALLQIIRNYPRIISTEIKDKVFKRFNYLTISFTVVSLFFLNTSQNLSGFTMKVDGPVDFIPGPIYYLLGVVSTFLLTSIVLFWKKHLAYYTRTQKVQVLSLLGILIFIFFSITLGFLVLPVIGLSTYSPLMFLSLSLLLFVVNKSLLVRVAVVDIQEEIVKLGGGLLASLLMLFFWDFIKLDSIGLDLVARFLISFLTLLLIYYVYSTVLGFYERKKSNAESVIRKFIDISRTLLTVESIMEQISSTLENILLTKNLKFVEYKEFQNQELLDKFSEWWAARSKTPFVNKEVLIESYFDKENNRDITKALYKYLQEESFDMIIPVSSNGVLIGLIFISGVKTIINESMYKNLTLLSDSISISISRALMYQELEQFNQTLQQKVNQQTKELQVKVKQLQEARKKERDMIDIMGHELRTPATVVKLNAELLEQFTDDVLNDKDKFELYIKRIKTAVDNEIKLINTLLSSAKLEGDKIELNPEKINIVEDIEMAIHGHEIEAKDKGLELVNNVSKDTPEIYADHARVIEVLNNLVSNAVKYTSKGSVTISSNHTEDVVSISVEDTGKGIPEEELSKLGQKFYRIQNYISEEEGKPDLVRPGGTGLGLYVTFGLVEKMGGKMEVESEVGKGTKFTFSLPRYNNQDNGITKENSRDMFQRLGLKR